MTSGDDEPRSEGASPHGSLAEAEWSLLAPALDGLPLGIALIDTQLQYRYVNPALAAINQRSPEDHVGRTVGEVLGELGRPAEETLIDLFRRGEPVLERDLTFPAPAGGAQSWARTTSLVRDAGGKVDAALVLVRHVRERERLAQALRESEDRFRLVVENSIDLTAILDRDGRFLYASPSYERILGHRPDGLVGSSAADLIHPDDVEGIRACWPAIVAGGRPTMSEVRLRHADGSWVAVEAAGRGIPTNGGEIQMVVVFGHDVSERKLAEEAVREREGLLRAMLDHSLEPLGLSENMRVLEVNRSWLDLFGYERSEAIGKGVVDFVAPESLDEVKRRHAERNEEPYEIVGLRKDGSRVRVIAHGRQITFCGRPMRLSMGRDVTALRDSEERYRALVENVDAIVWEGNPETFRFTFVNPVAERILGYPVADWLEPDFWVDHLHPEDRDEAVRSCLEAVGEKADHLLEYRMVAADGRRAVRLRDSVRVVLGPDGRIERFCGVMVDVTEEKAAEESRRALEEQLRDARRLETLGRLAGGVAHDFNNLLTGILGSVELAEARLAPDPSATELAEIRRAAQRAQDLTRQLLAVGRQQLLRLEALDFNQVVRELEDVIGRLLGPAVEVTFELAPDAGLVHADRGELQQIVINLAVNARDAMPAGGSFRVATAAVDGFTHLTVEDTGVGMDEATRSRAFEPFFTTKDVGGGSGLGLATVDGIVAQMGGRIELTSEPGVGSRFDVYLPRPEAGAEPAPTEARDARPVSGTETVLLVEDDDVVREVAVSFLEQNGYSVVATARSTDASELLRESRPALVVTDVVMPDLSGSELVEELRHEGYDGPVLYVSGFAPDVRLAGPHEAFLAKPFGSRDLLLAVRTLLDEA